MNNTPIPIDASRARNEFFNLLRRVYLEDVVFLVKKAGIPVAEISRTKEIKKKSLSSFAGIWKGTELDSDLFWKRALRGKSRKKRISL
ncbi:MAG: hypothetical protein ACPLXP_02010 [Microgenomates group bacterium]